MLLCLQQDVGSSRVVYHIEHRMEAIAIAFARFSCDGERFDIDKRFGAVRIHAYRCGVHDDIGVIMIFDGIEARPREAARDDGDLARAAVGHDRANRLRSAAGSQYENLLSLDRHAGAKLDKVGEAVIIGVVAVELTILLRIIVFTHPMIRAASDNSSHIGMTVSLYGMVTLIPAYSPFFTNDSRFSGSISNRRYSYEPSKEWILGE